MSDTTFVHCSLADANPGGTRSNFSITFEQSLHFPAGTRVRVNDVRLINSFPTITTVHNYLFVQQGSVLQMAFFLQSSRLKDACVMFVVTNRFHVEVTQEYGELQPEIREEISNKIAELKKKR